MDRLARFAFSLLSSSGRHPLSGGVGGRGLSLRPQLQQQHRGIKVVVYNGNVEQALGLLNRKMRDSGMESLIRKKSYFGRFVCDHHVKDSTRRYVSSRKIQYRVRNQQLFRTLKTLLAKKMRGH